MSSSFENFSSSSSSSIFGGMPSSAAAKLNEILQQQIDGFAATASHIENENKRLTLELDEERFLRTKYEAELSTLQVLLASSAQQLHSLQLHVTSADNEIAAQVKARMDLEGQLRFQIQELRNALTSLSERSRRIKLLEENERKLTQASTSLEERLIAVRTRKEVLEHQLTAATSASSRHQAALVAVELKIKELAKDVEMFQQKDAASASHIARLEREVALQRNTLKKQRDLHKEQYQQFQLQQAQLLLGEQKEREQQQEASGKKKASQDVVSSLATPSTSTSSSSSSSSLSTFALNLTELDAFRAQIVSLKGMLQESRTITATVKSLYPPKIEQLERQILGMSTENNDLRSALTSLQLQLTSHLQTSADQQQCHLDTIQVLRMKLLQVETELENSRRECNENEAEMRQILEAVQTLAQEQERVEQIMKRFGGGGEQTKRVANEQTMMNDSGSGGGGGGGGGHNDVSYRGVEATEIGALEEGDEREKGGEVQKLLGKKRG